MPTRQESAAATRTALLEAAGALLDIGGPEAVTLREVGARVGVSRSAPYRHFADKDSLLTVLATQAWTDVGDAMEVSANTAATSPHQSLRQALTSLISTGRTHPHLYRLMFTTPTADPDAAVRAAERAQDLFLTIVAKVVGPEQARQYAGLLLANAHGITALELSGHLNRNKWHATAEDLVELLIRRLPTPP